MKIELETGAKIVGTKRVSAKGQVSGLTEYAGKEVMVILVPTGKVALKTNVELLYHELQKAAEEHMELAFKQSKHLQDVFGTPQAAVKLFFDRYTPDSVKKVQSDMDKWLASLGADVVKEHMEKIVRAQMEEALKKYEELREKYKNPDEATKEFIKKYTPENTQKLMEDLQTWVDSMVPKQMRDEVKSAAEKHLILAFDQYESLREKYGTPNDAAKEFMKKHAPENVNKLMNDMEAWLDQFKPKASTKKK
jgi:uncharacterized protein YeaO (DUF488 family)